MQPSQTSFTLAAPASGIVRRTFATGPRRGPSVTTLTHSSELWAHFSFKTLPKRGQKITTQWILPSGKKLAANTRPAQRARRGAGQGSLGQDAAGRPLALRDQGRQDRARHVERPPEVAATIRAMALSHCRDELTPLLFLARSARVYPERTAVIDGDRTYTYAQFAARADALGRALRDRGIAPGERVAVLAPNRSELLEAHFGVPASGAVLCALNIRLAAAEIAQILAHSSSRLVLCDPDLRHLVPAGLDVIELGDAYEALLAGASDAPLAPGRSTRSRRSRSTTRAARRAGRRACCTATAAATSPRSRTCSRPASAPTAATSGRCRCSTATAGRTLGGDRGGRDARVPAQGRPRHRSGTSCERDHAPVRRADRARLALLAPRCRAARASAHDHDRRGPALPDRDRAHGGARREDRARVRADRDLRAVHGVRVAGRVGRAARRGAPPPEGAPGRAADHRRRRPRARCRRARRARRRGHAGRDRDARERRDARLPRRPRGHGARLRRRLVPLRATAPSCIPTATSRSATASRT